MFVLGNTYIHTYHSRFITEGVAELSQIFLRDSHVLPKLIVLDNDDFYSSYHSFAKTVK
jgi:hypothetical protein